MKDVSYWRVAAFLRCGAASCSPVFGGLSNDIEDEIVGAVMSGAWSTFFRSDLCAHAVGHEVLCQRVDHAVISPRSKTMTVWMPRLAWAKVALDERYRDRSLGRCEEGSLTRVKHSCAKADVNPSSGIQIKPSPSGANCGASGCGFS